MHTKKVTLSDILSSQRQHIIPVFQRPYSWTQRNWSELWSDIQALVVERDKSPEHFLGPMIIDHGDTGSYVPEKYLVIDGQQRLVTLSVLLCTLRDIAKRHEIDHFASSVEDFLTFKTTEGKAERRLLPRSADKSAFEKVLNRTQSAQDNKQQIVKAYRYFHNQIRKELRDDERDTFTYLNDMFTVIVARLKFVSITLEANDDPTKIYESMNFKGKLLLVSDLIRNFVLMHLPNGDMQDEFFDDVWEPFEKLFAQNDDDQLDAKALEDFYYRYLISRKGYFAKRVVYSKYKVHLSEFLERGESNLKHPDHLASLVAEQSRFAEYYRRIMQPNRFETDQDLITTFQRFGYLGARTATPFIMSLYARYEDRQNPNHISKQVFLQMMKALESFIIRRWIMVWRTRGYSEDFAEAVKRSESLQALSAYFQDIGWPADNEIREALEDFQLYSSDSNRCRLILEELEYSFGHKELVDLSNRDRIQIEHVMPQKTPLSAEWIDMLGENSTESQKKYCHTLGNLTLTGYNQELGTKSFPEKKKEYSKHGMGSHLELNKFILSKERWTENEIKERTRLLVEKVIGIWPRLDESQTNDA
ncbi:MAG: DUF262 domain-containing protein [Chloroflexi bacterium]|nr:DUF262 domain-containing protein [Chloroflexota bacterium]